MAPRAMERVRRELKYEEVTPISRREAIASLGSDDGNRVCDALVRVAFHDSDWRWVQDQCICLSLDQRASVRAISATCLGHLARIHGALDNEKVLPVLRKLLEDPETRGYAEDALDDIRMSLRWKR